MKKEIYGMTIVANASNVDDLMLASAEILKEFSEKIDEGVINQSAFLQGGGYEGHAQLIFTHSEDLDFSVRAQPDSPDTPAVDIPEEQEEIAADIPAPVMEILQQLEKMGAKIHLSRVEKKQ